MVAFALFSWKPNVYASTTDLENCSSHLVSIIPVQCKTSSVTNGTVKYIYKYYEVGVLPLCRIQGLTFEGPSPDENIKWIKSWVNLPNHMTKIWWGANVGTVSHLLTLQ